MPCPRARSVLGKLDFWPATLLVMGSIVGVGIFFTPAQVAERVDDPRLFLATWVLGALAAGCGAATFAELGTNRPRSGGWVVYLLDAFGPVAAFLFAWTILGVVATAAIAVIADFCAASLHGLWPGLGAPDTPRGLVLAACIPVGLTALAASGLVLGAGIQGVCMTAKLLAIGALVLAGTAFALPHGTSVDVSAPSPQPGSPVLALAAAILPVLFTYGGWQNLCYVAGETRRPERTLPRAILVGVLGVALLYLAFNGAAVRALGIEGLAGRPDFAERLARSGFGELGVPLVQLSMAVSALGVCLATVLVTPWIAVALAERGLFPAWLGRRHARTGAPIPALLVQCTLALAYLFASRSRAWLGPDRGWDLDPGGLVDSVAFAEWFFHGLVALALLRFRRASRSGAHWSTSRWLGPAPYLYLAIAVWVLVANLARARAEEIGLGAGVLLAGSLVAVRVRGRLKPSPSDDAVAG